MKVQKSVLFSPVIIILETEDEVQFMKIHLGGAADDDIKIFEESQEPCQGTLADFMDFTDQLYRNLYDISEPLN